MVNFGTLPETLFVIGVIEYSDGMSKMLKFGEELEVGCLWNCVHYRKTNLPKDAYSNRCQKPAKLVHLVHFDKNHSGPIVNSNDIQVVQLKESSVCEVLFSMSDIWHENKNYQRPLDNTQTIPPKSFIGEELILQNAKYIYRTVLYERCGGKNWLADEIKSETPVK